MNGKYGSKIGLLHLFQVKLYWVMILLCLKTMIRTWLSIGTLYWVLYKCIIYEQWVYCGERNSVHSIISMYKGSIKWTINGKPCK